MEIKIDKALIESLKVEFNKLRAENNEFSIKYSEGQFMAWFREIILPILQGANHV